MASNTRTCVASRNARVQMLKVLVILGIMGAPGQPDRATQLRAPAEPAQAAQPATSPLEFSLPTVESETQERPDSSDLRKEARDAQRRFERRRSRLAPQTWGGSFGDCDEQVGRFCLRFTEGTWKPQPDVPEVVEERDRLLEILYRVSEAIPGDPWVRGQLLWYLVEAGRPEEGRAVAAQCPVDTGWWCPAFRGLAAHVSGDFLASEAEFDISLAMVDSEDREEWTDVRDITDRDGRKWLERQDDGEAEDGLGPEDALERFWLLADPFYMVDGNERRTEHYARWLVARLRERARNTYGVSWGDDLRELLVRYGWEIGWERVRPRIGLLERANMIGHQHPDAVQFTPSGDVLEDTPSLAPGDWELESKQPRSTYAPHFAKAVDSLSAIYARFPRGDSTLIVVAYDTSWVDSLSSNVDETSVGSGESRSDNVSGALNEDLLREDAVLAVPLDGSAPPRPLAADPVAYSEGTWMITVPNGLWVVSAESLLRGADRGARTRFGVDAGGALPGVPVISDLLLLRPEGTMPTTLDEALAASSPLVHLLGESRVRVVWEVSGLGSRSETLAYSLELDRMDAGLFRRAARALRIVGEDETDLLTWIEAAAANETSTFRSLDLDLPDLDQGEYRLILSLQLAGRADMTVERRFRVSEESGTR